MDIVLETSEITSDISKVESGSGEGSGSTPEPPANSAICVYAGFIIATFILI